MSATMDGQPGLFDWRPLSAAERVCAEFDAANPEVWRLFVRFAFDRIGRGFRHHSADAILHRIRWETEVACDDGAGFKINNNASAYYARRFHREYPQHAGFFRLRTSRFDEPAHA